MNQKDFLNRLFELLTDNKKFPSYQAERRIDIFINLFLEEIIRNEYSDSKISFVAPEFPLKTSEISKKGKEYHRSTKVDYLCKRTLPESSSTILLIELKTDATSYNPIQHQIYRNYNTWEKCVTGLKEIIMKGKLTFTNRLKYFYLVYTLVQKELLASQDCIDTLKVTYDRLSAIPANEITQREKISFSSDFSSYLKNVEPVDLKTQVLYIGPKEIGENVKFKKFRDRLVEVEEFENIKMKVDNQEIWKRLVKMLNEK